MKNLFIALFAAVTLTTAYGLQCYVCDAHDSDLAEAECGDPFDRDEDLLETCNSTETFCRKRKSGVNHVWTKIWRACAEECETRNTAYVDRVDCCKTDGCNGGSILAPAVMLVVLSASILGFSKLL